MSQQPLREVEKTHTEEVRYWFIIDTNQYAGNFERELCAFVTGRYGECEVGKEIAEQVLKEEGEALAWTEEWIGAVFDEHGCSRPVKMVDTPTASCQGVAICFTEMLIEEEIQQLIQRAQAYTTHPSYTDDWDNQLVIESFRVLEERTTQTCIGVYPVESGRKEGREEHGKLPGTYPAPE